MSSRRDPVELDPQRAKRIQGILKDCVRRRSAGEVVTDQSMMDAHPDLLPELADELRNLKMNQPSQRETGQAGWHGSTLGISENLRVRCPDCQDSIEVVDDTSTSLSNVVCPSCGSQISLVDDTDRSYQAGQLEYVNHFQLLDKVGEGSFGTVWSARDTQLDRTVAIKLPRKGQISPDDQEQFIREARAAAQLKHPNIVSVLEVGRHEDRIYIACDFIQGLDLEDWLSDQKATPREAAETCATLADALQHAHDHGVIHRDLKPSNIMLDSAGAPHLMDFGLAKRETGELTMTVEGKLIGTPAYMSPEQARGSAHDADARSDVYSMGVILFELLTGERPFRGSTRMLLHQVLVEDAPSPRKLNSRIPKDLETICLKCLEKDPNRRYQAAFELREDLNRYLSGEPVHARPITQAARTWRWCRRNTTLATLMATVASLLVVGAIIAAIVAVHFRHLATVAEEAERNKTTSVIDMFTSLGIVAEHEAEASLWFANAVLRAQDDPGRDESNRLRFGAWSRNLPVPLHAFEHDGQWLEQIGFHPAGGFLLAVSIEGNCTVWNLSTEQKAAHAFDSLHVNCAAWSPNGKTLAIGLENKVEIRSVPSFKCIQSIDHAGPISALSFSNDGSLLAIASQSVRIWGFQQQDFVTPIFDHPQRVSQLTFDPQGERLATGCEDERARVYPIGQNAIGKEPLVFPNLLLPQDPRPENKRISVGPVFVDDGRGLLTLTGRDQFTLWNSESGKQLRRVELEGINYASSTPDQEHFVVCGYQEARFWSSQGETVGELMKHLNHVYTSAFSPDGRKLVTVSADGSSRLWSVPSGRQLAPPLRHQADVRLTAFAPDGQSFATAQADGLVRIWQLNDGQPDGHELSLGAYDFVRVSPDGTKVVFGGWNYLRELRMARVYAVATGAPLGMPMHLKQQLHAATFSPDGNTIVTISSLTGQPGLVTFWDWRTAARLLKPCPTPSEPVGVDYGRDGKFVVVVCKDGQTLVIDTETGSVRKWLGVDGDQHAIRGYVIRDWVKFAPNGKLCATWGIGNKVRVWASTSWELQCELAPQQSEQPAYCHDVCFSNDGRIIITASSDNTVGIWDTRTGQPEVAPLEHPDWVFSARLSPDERHVLTACRDHMARLWDWRTGKLVGPALEHMDEVFGVGFSPDGRHLFTISRDKTARVWESKNGKPLMPPLPLGRAGYQIVVTPDGEFALATAYPRNTYVFHYGDFKSRTSQELDATSLVLLSEILSGKALHEYGGSMNLTTREWLDRWRQFHRKYPRFHQRK